jgi:predicted phage terminase large subunit-like protein
MQPRSLASQLADALADGGWRARARIEQLAPLGAWRIWLLLAGRGFGKTLAGSGWVHELVQAGYGRIALVAPTAADARDVMVEGVSGILETAPNWNRPQYEPSKRRLTWPNGASATTFSSEESERLRGPNHDAAWCDELGAWNEPQATWDQLQFTLRTGADPRITITTTPKPFPLLRALVAREGRDVVITRGSTFANAANLAPGFLDAITLRYGGTRIGRQEIEAELLSDTPGALWQLDWLDRDRVTEAPELRRIVVAIDPAVSNHEGSDETGIIVAGLGHDGHIYVVEDLSGRFQPHEWAARAIAAYRRHHADRIIAEKNQGGLMVEGTIRSLDRNVAFRGVHAARGKVTRAEPISALYEQHRVHHVGTYQALEDQLCSFTSDFDRSRAGYSPDRLDALVWACTELIPPTYGPGEAMLEVARQQMAEMRARGDVPTPEPIAREWAKGSVEWERQQRGEIGPPPQTVIPAHHIGRPGGSFDDDMNEKFRSMGLIG